MRFGGVRSATLVALFALALEAAAEGQSCAVNHYILGFGPPCPDSFVPGTIDPHFTGSWYDPGQSGQGLSLEVLPNYRLLAFWFAFNPDGTQQTWLVGTGAYAGNTATLTAVDMPTGGRWIPNFDPIRVVNNAWGTLTLTFSDADHGRVDFSSTLGYGTGSMNLTRLTTPQLRWVRTGRPLTPRSWGDTATLLADGRVLVAGGGTADSVLDTAEIYDPATGSWTATGRLTRPRVDHTATSLPDGKVLVVGGDCKVDMQSLGCAGTAELYDPAVGAWSPTGGLNTPRAGFTATLLSTGKVLVAGGVDNSDDSLGSAELYDPATGTWTFTGNLVTPRLIHTATVLADGRVLVVGGWYDDMLQQSAAAAEIYDPVSGTWSSTGGLHQGRAVHTATRLADGRVLVAGGEENGLPPQSFDEAELYDPVTGKWTVVNALSHRRYGHSATLLPSGRVLVAGGSDFVSPRVTSAETFDPTSETWTDAGNVDAALYAHRATLLTNGDVLIVGGADAELYHDPGGLAAEATGTWFDPAEPGQGLLLEALSGNRLLAEWFAFDPAGTQQAWFLGVGSYSGSEATISSVEQPTGGRWIPNFDRSRIVNGAWGSLKFTFTDCNHATVDFDSVNGFGSGSLNLVRLTRPAGSSCP